MAKKRVYEIAKERGISSKELLAALQGAGMDVKAAASTIDEADALRALSDSPDGAQGGGDGAAATRRRPFGPCDGRARACARHGGAPAPGRDRLAGLAPAGARAASAATSPPQPRPG